MEAGWEWGADIVGDGAGNLFLIGQFEGTNIDFDTTSGIDTHTSNGNNDLFITKFTSDDEYLWTRTYGSALWDATWYGDIDPYGNVYVFGYLTGPTDFNVGEGEDIRTTDAAWGQDSALVSYANDGTYNWVHTFSSDTYSDAYGVMYNPINSSIYLTGSFGITTDFDPFASHDSATSDASGDFYLTKLYIEPPATNSPTTNSPAVASNKDEAIQISVTGKWNETGGVIIPVKDSDTAGQKVLVILEPKTLGFNAFLSVIQEATLAPTATTIRTGNSIGFKRGNSIFWQVGKVQKVYFKAYSPAQENPIIIPSLQNKPSILSLSYTADDLIPAGDVAHPFSPSTLHLAHSPDGKSWMLMPSSVVDENNKTVSAIAKIGGYYMIVAKPVAQPSISTVQSATDDDQPAVNPMPLPTPISTPSPVVPPKQEKCFLRWCW